jgi:hypothetical protein
LIGDCRKAADEQQRHYWKLTREGQDLLVGSMEWMRALHLFRKWKHTIRSRRGCSGIHHPVLIQDRALAIARRIDDENARRDRGNRNTHGAHGV